MSFTPEHSLKELAYMAGFNTIDELACYAKTSKTNLHNWNKAERKQEFLMVVIVGAKIMKAKNTREEAQKLKT